MLVPAEEADPVSLDLAEEVSTQHHLHRKQGVLGLN